VGRPTERSIRSSPFWDSAAGGQAESALASRAARSLTLPLAPLYSLAVRLRRSLYDRGWLNVEKLPVPVISVGNLTVGGTGKSPMAAMVARMLARLGTRPAVVTRGYGGNHTGLATIVSRGTGPVVDAEAAGDEAVMLAAQLASPSPGIPVIVSRRRADGGRLAVSDLSAGCVILDDGFQHLALARDLNLLLLDGSDPFGNGRMLPAGILREPVDQMRRADAIIINRADVGSREARAAIEAAASRYCPAAPVLHARSRLTGLRDAKTGQEVGVERLPGARLLCFAGIARAERFFQDMAAAGGIVVGSLRFPDHHRFSETDIQRIAATAAGVRADMILTTQKDLARLSAREALERLAGLHAALIETQVEEAAQLESLLKRVSS